MALHAVPFPSQSPACFFGDFRQAGGIFRFLREISPPIQIFTQARPFAFPGVGVTDK
ncbi:hypothetical protein [Shinella sp.]|uniref:hypothetical protein n=1 Tax=Shinella sp. TaxID=1870904 RepID=UPI0028B1E447|nr:hypothetical protein [Shinella sp.]